MFRWQLSDEKGTSSSGSATGWPARGQRTDVRGVVWIGQAAFAATPPTWCRRCARVQAAAEPLFVNTFPGAGWLRCPAGARRLGVSDMDVRNDHRDLLRTVLIGHYSSRATCHTRHRSQSSASASPSTVHRLALRVPARGAAARAPTLVGPAREQSPETLGSRPRRCFSCRIAPCARPRATRRGSRAAAGSPFPLPWRAGRRARRGARRGPAYPSVADPPFSLYRVRHAALPLGRRASAAYNSTTSDRRSRLGRWRWENISPSSKTGSPILADARLAGCVRAAAQPRPCLLRAFRLPVAAAFAGRHRLEQPALRRAALRPVAVPPAADSCVLCIDWWAAGRTAYRPIVDTTPLLAAVCARASTAAGAPRVAASCSSPPSRCLLVQIVASSPYAA